MVIPTEAGPPRSAESRVAWGVSVYSTLPLFSRLQLTSGIVGTKEAELRERKLSRGSQELLSLSEGSGRSWKTLEDKWLA